MIKSFLLLLILLLSIITQVSNQGSAHISSGTFKIVNQKSKKVLGVAGSSLQDGAKVNQYQPTGAISQRWYLYYEGIFKLHNSFSIINVNSQKALDNPGSSNQSGTKMQQFTYNAGNNQFFFFEENGDGTVMIRNIASGLWLGIEGASTADGTALIQSGYTGDGSQKWYWVLTDPF